MSPTARPGQRRDARGLMTDETAASANIEHGEPGGHDQPTGLLKIGTVAARLGISERTLRYYEEVGLLRPAVHEPGGSRRYCDADVERVQRIRELQNLMGFNLEEIRSVVAAEDRLRSLRDRFRHSANEEQQHIFEEADQVLTDLRTQVETKVRLLTDFLQQLDARIQRHKDRQSAWESSSNDPQHRQSEMTT